MKNKWLLIVLAMIAITAVGGCSQESVQSSVETEQKDVSVIAAESEVQVEESAITNPQISIVAESEEKVFSKPESSREEEPSVDEKKVKTDQAKKDIAVLAEYKKGIEPVKDINWSFNYADGGRYPNNNKGKLYYVDSVIRDINDDGIYELIVKYDLRAENFPNSEDTWTIYNTHPAYTYDIVSVVNGKAVATEHYLNEEGIFHQGEAK